MANKKTASELLGVGRKTKRFSKFRLGSAATLPVFGWSEETGLETVAVTVGTHVSL